MANRPLSPHLQIWKWGPHMAVSILHRASGSILAFVGLPLMLWWIGALAAGPEAYASFASWIWTGEGDGLQGIVSILARIALVVTTWALFEHTLSGLRHFVLDAGAGYELDTNKFWSRAVLIGAPVLTAAFWAALLLR
ncbi:succinate dehydrogenase, cytochrome b556 subunit [Altererythrobacter aerius]|uniref:Succinate dehydrogenase cytochrome b556 subunit n=1 Tax=Tsuneonella aeria TaxID=1837929 RepID=A0A6I4TAN4_9SPHN|nr:succinate dehydrogenase, cytochrome b556 subunit [Tsuneonella aeria]MXO73737.1 succinate dehydrogenase, cytochrome b556 subunit [Tsuneonella aeria]